MIWFMIQNVMIQNMCLPKKLRLLWGAHIVQAVALRFGDLFAKSHQAKVWTKNKASAGETETYKQTLHIYIYSSFVALFYLKLFQSFSHFRYRKDMKKSQNGLNQNLNSRVRPWGQWTPGAQWYLAGIHHSLCLWTSRRGTAEVGWSCTHHTGNARNKYTFSCQNSSDSHRRSICPKANWNIWSLWTQIGCTLLVDL